MEQALDERNHVAVLIRHRHVHSVRVVVVGLHISFRSHTLGVDSQREAAQTIPVEQLIYRYAHGVRIRDAAVPVGYREANRLGNRVQVVGAVVLEGLQV